jgi:hypothetical protein
MAGLARGNERGNQRIGEVRRGRCHQADIMDVAQIETGCKLAVHGAVLMFCCNSGGLVGVAGLRRRIRSRP